MKSVRLVVALVSLLVFQALLCNVPSLNVRAVGSTDVFVGVDFGYGDVAESKALIDQVSSYTNLIGIGSSAITGDLTKLNETCQYAYEKGLSIVSLTPNLGRANRTGWLTYATQTWADRMLGFYVYDEPAGRQLDKNESRIGTYPIDYIDAANQFESNMSRQLSFPKNYLRSTNYQLFTSDYALYWFDYKSGYDTIFAEFGWNLSKQLNAALCRGAATMQNKDWGVMILWTYTAPPYLESGTELLKDLILAYDNGAKYVLIFDSNVDYTQGILEQEHLSALQQFWQYIHNNARKAHPLNERVAYVLPNGYGYGFRGPNDKIWGIWEADAFAYNVSITLGYLIEKYGTKLDIIYDDGLQPGNNGYSQLIYWNDTALIESLLPTPTPQPTPTTTQNPTNIQTPPSNIDYTPEIVIGVIIAIAVLPLLIIRKRQFQITFAQTGIGRDFNGTVLTIDGKDYDKYGASFLWAQGTSHTYEFKNPIILNHSKQYILTRTSGLSPRQSDTIKVQTTTTITGIYRPVFKNIKP